MNILLNLRRMVAVSGLTAISLASWSGACQNTAVWHRANRRHLDPTSQPALSVCDKRVRATIKAAPQPLVIDLQTLQTPENEVKVQLPLEIAQVDELILSKDRLIVRGMLNNAAAVVIVFDENTGKQIDEIYGYWPAISPKADFILFTKLYPTHFSNGTEDHYMVYRLDAPLETNRPPDSNPANSFLVGMPLYPLIVGNNNFDNVELSAPLHAQTAAGFFWNNRGTQVVTLDSFEGKYNLILFRFGIDDVKVETREVSKDQLCRGIDAFACSPHFYLEDAVFKTAEDGSESIAATLGYPQSPPGTVVSFPLADFKFVGIRSLSHPKWTDK